MIKFLISKSVDFFIFEWLNMFIKAEITVEWGGAESVLNVKKINKHKRKAAAPHGRLPHTNKSPGLVLSSFAVVAPPFILPELLHGTRDRWVVQVSLIIIYSTGLARFPRLSAPPHLSQTAIMLVMVSHTIMVIDPFMSACISRFS